MIWKRKPIACTRAAGARIRTRPQVEHKAAFNSFMRKGNEDGLLDLERKALGKHFG